MNLVVFFRFLVPSLIQRSARGAFIKQGKNRPFNRTNVLRNFSQKDDFSSPVSFQYVFGRLMTYKLLNNNILVGAYFIE